MGITTLGHVPSCMDAFEGPAVELRLGLVCTTWELARHPQLPSDQGENGWRHQAIGQDEVGLLDGLTCCVGEQVRVSGTRAHKPHAWRGACAARPRILRGWFTRLVGYRQGLDAVVMSLRGCHDSARQS